MSKTSYLKSKEGGFVIAFVSIMIAFVFILLGFEWNQQFLSITGFVIVMLAMLYAPIRKYLIDKK